jgi:hypothetical protein
MALHSARPVPVDEHVRHAGVVPAGPAWIARITRAVGRARGLRQPAGSRGSGLSRRPTANGLGSLIRARVVSGHRSRGSVARSRTPCLDAIDEERRQHVESVLGRRVPVRPEHDGRNAE